MNFLMMLYEINKVSSLRFKMPKLSNKFLSNNIIKSLKSIKVHSVNDFLQADIEKLVASEIDEKEIIELTPKLIAYYSAVPRNGYNLYQYLLRKTSIIKTFIKGLDELLNGGLLTGSILEICGLSGTGKTQICLSITINVVLNEKFNVTYIDTKNDLHSSRLLEILQTNDLLEDPDILLERINCIHVEDIYKLITTLDSIKNNWLPKGKLGKIIILDSLPTLFFPFIGLGNNEGLSLLNHIASLLKRIAVDKHIAIILTNLGNIYEDNLDSFKLDELRNNYNIENDIRPALGKYWNHVPNTRITISAPNRVNYKRSLVVRKSDYIKLGSVCNFEIFQGGVR